MMIYRKMKSKGIALGALFVLCLLFWMSAPAPEVHAALATPPKCEVCGQACALMRDDAPTCQSVGYYVYICRDHNKLYLIEYGEILPHNWRQIGVNDPTCTEKGSITQECMACKTKETVDNGDPLGHNYTEEVIAPTCSSIGYTRHACQRCGDAYQTDQVGTLPHTYEQTVMVEPTCHSVGQMRNICLVCNYFSTEEIPTVPHDYATEVIPPTHTEQGYTIYTCRYEGCGTVKREDFTPTREYTMIWDETPATCTSTGMKIGICSCGCGHAETVVIPRLEHAFGDWIIIREATPDEMGLRSRVCVHCQHAENKDFAYDPDPDSQESKGNMLTVGAIAFLLLVAVIVVFLVLLLLLEHARRDKQKRSRTRGIG